MIHYPQNIKTICHSNPDRIFAEGLSHELKVRSISLFVGCLEHVPGDISILKLNKTSHQQTHSCPRLTLSRKEAVHLVNLILLHISLSCCWAWLPPLQI